MKINNDNQSIPLPNDIQSAIDKARQNVAILEAEERKLRSVCNSLAIELEEKVNHKKYLDEENEKIEGEIKAKNKTLASIEVDVSSALKSYESIKKDNEVVNRDSADKRKEADELLKSAKETSEDIVKRENILSANEKSLQEEKQHFEKKKQKLIDAMN